MNIGRAKDYIVAHPDASAEEIICMFGFMAWENATWELAMDGTTMAFVEEGQDEIVIDLF
jgi:hypothetical protein